jgi:hypothetical protein
LLCAPVAIPLKEGAGTVVVRVLGPGFGLPFAVVDAAGDADVDAEACVVGFGVVE